MMNPALRQLTEDELRALPPVIDVQTVAAALGVGRSHLYELIRCTEFPLPVLKIGRVIRVPSAALLEFMRVQR